MYIIIAVAAVAAAAVFLLPLCLERVAGKRRKDKETPKPCPPCSLQEKACQPAIAPKESQVHETPETVYSEPKDRPTGNETVLVGALADRSQLYVCLGCNFYHMPAGLAGKGYKDIKYIAVYQSRRFFGSDAGVRYYAKVRSAKKVRREQITEIDKGGHGYYIRFETEEWQTLEPPILSKGEGITAAVTNYSLLISARDMDMLLGR